MAQEEQVRDDHGRSEPPDVGRVEPVTGTGTGLFREVGRMADGRSITYYSLPTPTVPPASGEAAGA